MQALPAGGAMVAVQAAEDEVAPLLADPAWSASRRSTVPTRVVLSGDEDAVLAVAGELAERGPQDPAAAGQPRLPLAADGTHARRVPRRRRATDLPAATIPLVSTLTGRLATDGQFGTADYWVDQVAATRYGSATPSPRCATRAPRRSWSWAPAACPHRHGARHARRDRAALRRHPAQGQR